MMKKIIYVGYVISDAETKNATGVSIAGNKMQLNILKELCKYDDMQVFPITVYPCASYPADSKLIYKRRREVLWDKVYTERIGFINLPIIKQICQMIQVYCSIKKLLKKFPDAEIFSFNMFSQTGNPLRWLKHQKKVKVSAILADLPIDIDQNRKGLPKLLMEFFYAQTRKNIKILDQAIVLNRFAAESYLNHQKYIVVEGGIHINKNDINIVLKKKYEEREKVIVYSGALVEYNGIRNLIQAMEIVQEDVVLRLYGDGPMSRYVQEIAKRNVKIEYMGKVTNQEMIDIQRKAYLLINPRPVDDPISRVTFPSKIFEYLASGTVVLSTKLNGFSEDYFDKMFFFDGDDSESMAFKIDECLQVPPEKMEQMARKAYQFITQEKNWEKQGKKIHDFLM